MRDHNEVFESVMRQRDEALKEKKKEGTALIWTRAAAVAACIAVVAAIALPVMISRRAHRGPESGGTGETEQNIGGLVPHGSGQDNISLPDETRDEPNGAETDISGGDTQKPADSGTGTPGKTTEKDTREPLEGATYGGCYPESSDFVIAQDISMFLADAALNSAGRSGQLEQLTGSLPAFSLSQAESSGRVKYYRCEYVYSDEYGEDGPVSLLVYVKDTESGPVTLTALWTWKSADVSSACGFDENDLVGQTDETAVYIKKSN